MNPAEQLQYLYDIIDRYTAEEKAKNEGPFGFLREEMYVREISCAVTERSSVERLKTYLTKEILEVNHGMDYVTYKNILENLTGSAAKRYQVNPLLLEKCFDCEENRKAIRSEEEHFWLEKQKVADLLEPEDRIPWLLFQLLAKDAGTHLYQLWRSFDRQGENLEFQKQEYMNILHGIALQEIFYREFLKKPTEQKQEELAEYAGSLSETYRKKAEQVKKAGSEPVKDREEIVQDVQENLQKVAAMQQKLRMYVVLEAEQNINISVEFQVLLMLGAMNTGKPSGKWLNTWMATENENKIPAIFAPNPNRSKAFRALDEEAYDVLVQYWRDCPDAETWELKKAIHIYFEQLELELQKSKKADSAKMKKAKKVIVRGNLARQKREKADNEQNNQ